MCKWHTGVHVSVSSGTRVYEASVQVCRRDVAYDHPSSRFTDSGRLKANNKCKLQSEEQIGAGEDNCSIMALRACACVCTYVRVCVCILYNRGGKGGGVTKYQVLTSQTDT